MELITRLNILKDSGMLSEGNYNKVLKVIDVGNAVMVDVADTNRLIDE